jgi:cholesterol oxidase
MAGYFHVGATDFREGWSEGRDGRSHMNLEITVHISVLEEMVRDPQHRAEVTGTVECAALSAHPMTVTHGEVRLLAIDREQVGAREMVYTLALESVEGPRYEFRGRKDVHDDPGADLWSDTTTLSVVVRADDDVAGAEIGRGMLRLSAREFVRLVAGMRVTNARSVAEKLAARAAYGRFFAASLYDVYGGVFSRAAVADARQAPREKRALSLPAPEIHSFATDDGVNLRLTRYRGGNKGPVMLVAGMGTTTLSFTLDTIDVNLAEFLCAAGYDTWLFDYRASPAVPAVREQCTLDDIALRDYPAAIREIRLVTDAETVQVVAHCVGSITLLMSLAAGTKHIRSAICSQSTMFFDTTWLLRLKAALHLGALLPKLGFNLLTAKYDASARWTDRFYDVLLRFYPAYRGERCDSPVCRRIRFIYGETFTHGAINHDTHRLLGEIFGEANLTILNHLSQVVRAGHVVDNSGQEAYLPHIDRIKTPITFLQGARNKIFLPDGSRKTWQALSDKNGQDLYERRLFPELAHMDLFIGKNAHREVYPYVVSQLDKYND